MTKNESIFRNVSRRLGLSVLTIFSLFIFSIIIQAQPEFSDSELRLIREKGYLFDSLKHKLPQEKFPMSEISDQNRASFVDGDIDPNFNASVTEGFGYVNETVVQPDGKIIAVGLFQKANSTRVATGSRGLMPTARSIRVLTAEAAQTPPFAASLCNPMAKLLSAARLLLLTVRRSTGSCG